MICYERKRWGDGPSVTFLLWVWHTRLHFPHTSSTSLRVVDWLVKSKSEIPKCWWPYCSSWLNISVIKESVKQLLTELIRSRNPEASGSSSKWERVVSIIMLTRLGWLASEEESWNATCLLLLVGLFTRREILVSSRSDPSTPPPVIPSVSPPHPRLSLFICTSFSWKLERSDPAHSRLYHRLLSSYSWPRSTLSLHQWHVGPYSPTGGPQCSRLYRFAWLWMKVKGMPVLSGQCPGEKMRSCYPGAGTAHHHNCSHSYNTSRDAQAEETLMRGWLLLTKSYWHQQYLARCVPPTHENTSIVSSQSTGPRHSF